jgi:serine/threonine protein kinase
LKLLLHEQSSEPAATQRFISEGQTQSRLNHPNIVQVYDMGRDRDWLYIAMEFVPGETLRYFTKRRLLSLKDSLSLVRDVAEGLSFAHKNGLIHRDIKPSNILIDEHGRARIIDFGIAKASEGSEADVKTRAGLIVGSLNYIAPEIFQGQPASPGSDFYSLGLVLFECLTGRLPFSSENRFETLSRIREGTLEVPKGQRGLIPKSTLDLVRNLTHPDPQNRLNDGEKVLAAIDIALADLDLRPLGPEWSQSLYQSGLTIHKSAIEAVAELKDDHSGLNWVLSFVFWSRLQTEPSRDPEVSIGELTNGAQALQQSRGQLQELLGASAEEFIRKAEARKESIPWRPIAAGVALALIVLGVGLWRVKSFSEQQRLNLASQVEQAAPVNPTVPAPRDQEQSIEGFAGLIIDPPGVDSSAIVKLASTFTEPTKGQRWTWTVIDSRSGVEIKRTETWTYLGSSQGLHVVQVDDNPANRLWFGPNWVADLRAATGHAVLSGAKALNRSIRGQPDQLIPLRNGRSVVFERSPAGSDLERLTCESSLSDSSESPSFLVQCRSGSEGKLAESWTISHEGHIKEFSPAANISYRLEPNPESSSK